MSQPGTRTPTTRSEYTPAPNECQAWTLLMGRVEVVCNAPPPCNGRHSYDSPSGFTVQWSDVPVHANGSPE